MSKMNDSLVRSTRRYYKHLRNQRDTVVSILNNYRKIHGIPMHRTVHMKRVAISKLNYTNPRGIPKHQ